MYMGPGRWAVAAFQEGKCYTKKKRNNIKQKVKGRRIEELNERGTKTCCVMCRVHRLAVHYRLKRVGPFLDGSLGFEINIEKSKKRPISRLWLQDYGKRICLCWPLSFFSLFSDLFRTGSGVKIYIPGLRGSIAWMKVCVCVCVSSFYF